MKLAEALLEIKTLKEHIAFLNDYLCQNVIYQDGSSPTDSISDLLLDLKTSLRRQEKLVAMVNLRNCITRVDNCSLTEMMAHKDALLKEIAIKQNMLKSASQPLVNIAGSAIKMHTNLDGKKLRKDIDDLAKELRELNNKLQSTNWSTEL